MIIDPMSKDHKIKRLTESAFKSEIDSVCRYCWDLIEAGEYINNDHEIGWIHTACAIKRVEEE